jgi:D-lactate dehydrogenase
VRLYFTETEESDERFFSEALAGQELRFVDTLRDVGAEAEILSVYIHHRIGAEFLEAHPSLQLIATRSTGHDHIDLEECRKRNVKVAGASSADDNSVAEHTFMLMLAVARRLMEVREANRRSFFRYENLRSHDLKDKTLGVIGTGRIGLRVVRIALAFGMNVLAHDPYRRSLMGEILGLRYVSFDELLRQSDVISLHVPLTKETYHMIDRDALSCCRPGVILINTARGAVIDTVALNEALDKGIVAGAGLDVLEDERVMQKDIGKLMSERIIKDLQGPSEEAVLQRPEGQREIQNLMQNQRVLARHTVVFTPHVAFNSVEAVQRINQITADTIVAFLRRQPIQLIAAA